MQGSLRTVRTSSSMQPAMPMPTSQHTLALQSTVFTSAATTPALQQLLSEEYGYALAPTHFLAQLGQGLHGGVSAASDGHIDLVLVKDGYTEVQHMCIFEEALKYTEPDMEDAQLKESAWSAMEASKGSHSDSLLPPLVWQPSVPVRKLQQEGVNMRAVTRPIAVALQEHVRVVSVAICQTTYEYTEQLQLQPAADVWAPAAPAAGVSPMEVAAAAEAPHRDPQAVPEQQHLQQQQQQQQPASDEVKVHTWTRPSLQITLQRLLSDAGGGDGVVPQELFLTLDYSLRSLEHPEYLVDRALYRATRVRAWLPGDTVWCLYDEEFWEATITGVKSLDPQWTGSEWRLLTVSWTPDDTAAVRDQDKQLHSWEVVAPEDCPHDRRHKYPRRRRHGSQHGRLRSGSLADMDQDYLYLAGRSGSEDDGGRQSQRRRRAGGMGRAAGERGGSGHGDKHHFGRHLPLEEGTCVVCGSSSPPATRFCRAQDCPRRYHQECLARMWEAGLPVMRQKISCGAADAGVAPHNTSATPPPADAATSASAAAAAAPAVAGRSEAPCQPPCPLPGTRSSSGQQPGGRKRGRSSTPSAVDTGQPFLCCPAHTCHGCGRSGKVECLIWCCGCGVVVYHHSGCVPPDAKRQQLWVLDDGLGLVQREYVLCPRCVYGGVQPPVASWQGPAGEVLAVEQVAAQHAAAAAAAAAAALESTPPPAAALAAPSGSAPAQAPAPAAPSFAAGSAEAPAVVAAATLPPAADHGDMLEEGSRVLSSTALPAATGHTLPAAPAPAQALPAEHRGVEDAAAAAVRQAGDQDVLMIDLTADSPAADSGPDAGGEVAYSRSGGRSPSTEVLEVSPPPLVAPAAVTAPPVQSTACTGAELHSARMPGQNAVAAAAAVEQSFQATCTTDAAATPTTAPVAAGAHMTAAAAARIPPAAAGTPASGPVLPGRRLWDTRRVPGANMPAVPRAGPPAGAAVSAGIGAAEGSQRVQQAGTANAAAGQPPVPAAGAGCPAAWGASAGSGNSSGTASVPVAAAPAGGTALVVSTAEPTRDPPSAGAAGAGAAGMGSMSGIPVSLAIDETQRDSVDSRPQNPPAGAAPPTQQQQDGLQQEQGQQQTVVAAARPPRPHRRAAGGVARLVAALAADRAPGDSDGEGPPPLTAAPAAVAAAPAAAANSAARGRSVATAASEGASVHHMDSASSDAGLAATPPPSEVHQLQHMQAAAWQQGSVRWRRHMPMVPHAAADGAGQSLPVWLKLALLQQQHARQHGAAWRVVSDHPSVSPLELGAPTAVYIFGDKHSDDIKYGLSGLGTHAKTMSLNWASSMIDVYPQSEAAEAASAAAELLLQGQLAHSQAMRRKQEGAHQQLQLGRLQIEYWGMYTAERDEQASAAASSERLEEAVSSATEGAAGGSRVRQQTATAARGVPGAAPAQGRAQGGNQQRGEGDSSSWGLRCAEADRLAAAAVRVFTNATGQQWRPPRVFLQVSSDPRRFVVPTRLRQVAARSLRAELQAGDRWTVNALTFQLHRLQTEAQQQVQRGNQAVAQGSQP